ncbi:UDPglucose 6-dehydrogenase [Sinobaca qinghaiensis]|uniref:UDP-glucose 6-dehydrogenase n=1 Tax=Sinobaca qinghaiensis TaxID=342944 RepID=A0A419V871_9BACL|nr:UDP-glucose/GDP-mannose dehydrogenase family protein [Sinobaca qinghaiensis]RKD76314.1 UDPglucose 6-dehydrogenase [Sinobaca qinghaiensis]
MNISVVGTGYVGLVTGVSLSEIGHHVTCLDIDKEKVAKLLRGESPIYEPGIEEMMRQNIENGHLHFTSDYKEACEKVEALYIAVGTPEKEDGTADLRFVEAVVQSVASNIKAPLTVITKSTVPVGTNDKIQALFYEQAEVPVHVVSNPEFLREGSAIHDTFYGDRIIIGADNEEAGDVVALINKAFGIPIFRTDCRSAEMIKYASNAFLATKISYINEISNLCEFTNANVEDVAKGMGMDKRIGANFLNAGIGYGGSCFPKDTSALLRQAENQGMAFPLMNSIITTNAMQQLKLIDKAEARFGSLKDKKVAVLGLAFKPNTDDMRAAPSIPVTERLVLDGATVNVYDPIAMDAAKNVLPKAITYTNTMKECIENAEIIFILTEWKDIVADLLPLIKENGKRVALFDGRNCYGYQELKDVDMEYYSIGRPGLTAKLETVHQ